MSIMQIFQDVVAHQWSMTTIYLVVGLVIWIGINATVEDLTT